VVRATAFGYSQWMRTPPPVASERVVTIEPAAAGYNATRPFQSS